MDHYLSALEIAALIKNKELSPLEVVDSYLERTDRLNPKLNAIVWRRDEELRAEAKIAGDRIGKGEDLGPFGGVPIPIKDLVDVAGWPTTFGSRAARDRVATVTSSMVESFKGAGFLLMNRTNTPEFGSVAVTENSLFGATRNPWSLDHTPGGSSGGSAAAVAAGLAPIGHANDGGGSIRIPASCCGLVGLKPSRGRISSGPLISDVMHGGAVEGVVARTVADTAAVLDCTSAPDPGAWYNAPRPERSYLAELAREPGRLRIGFTTKSPMGAPVDGECAEAVLRTAKLLEDLGHEVFEAEPDWPPAEFIEPAFLQVWCTSCAYWDVSDWELVEPHNRALREQALSQNSVDYVQTLLMLQIFTRQITACWGRDFDYLLTPTLAQLPPAIGAMFDPAGPGGDDPLAPLHRCAELTPFTPLFNITGQPAVSLPLAWSESGLPIGVQIVGGPWEEAGLIRLAAQLEAAVPWRSRRPSLD
jgi:amidase